VVPGFGGATICLDRNRNARCDTDEPSTVSDATGAFELTGSGALAADVIAETTGDWRTQTASGSHALVLRAPASARPVLSPVSTELVAMMDANGGALATARDSLAGRLGVPEARLLDDPALVSDPSLRAALQAENALLLPRIAAAVAQAGLRGDRALALRNRLALDAIDTLVVIYAENRAFDTLYGLFPGANGIPGRNPASTGTAHPQRDFDGNVLPTLPPVWGGVSGPGQPATLTQAQTVGMGNRMFQIDDPKGFNGSGVLVGADVTTRDLVHRYYSNIAQINGGRNDGFAAWSDAGALSMGYYDGSGSRLWKLAQQYTLADSFFMGAFGGSFLNHQYLICACAPTYPNADADASPAKDSITLIETDAQGRFKRLVPADTMPASALVGPPRLKRDSTLTPKDAMGMFHAVNTMQPAYQPSYVAPAPGSDARYADPGKPTTLPPQTQATIGDRLDAKGVAWAWYAGAWNKASAGTPAARSIIYGGREQFQAHHQPFNYQAAFDPATKAAARAAHLKDFDTAFLADAAAGKLPAVTFYKPQGNVNQHAGYANLTDGDAHIADVIAALQHGPQWRRMLVVVTYDENGGFYDHAAVPAGDRWGPGTRIPALIVSPFARKGFIDKTQYDTGSILRFITHRWSLDPLPGITERDTALLRNGGATMGDLTGALDFSR
jgi:acid phosphatase